MTTNYFLVFILTLFFGPDPMKLYKVEIELHNEAMVFGYINFSADLDYVRQDEFQQGMLTSESGYHLKDSLLICLEQFFFKIGDTNHSFKHCHYAENIAKSEIKRIKKLDSYEVHSSPMKKLDHSEIMMLEKYPAAYKRLELGQDGIGFNGCYSFSYWLLSYNSFFKEGDLQKIANKIETEVAAALSKEEVTFPSEVWSPIQERYTKELREIDILLIGLGGL